MNNYLGIAKIENVWVVTVYGIENKHIAVTSTEELLKAVAHQLDHRVTDVKLIWNNEEREATKEDQGE